MLDLPTSQIADEHAITPYMYFIVFNDLQYLCNLWLVLPQLACDFFFDFFVLGCFSIYGS